MNCYFLGLRVSSIQNTGKVALIRLVLFFLFFSLMRGVYGQSPSANFIIDNGCTYQNLKVLNTSTNADSFSWDFCADDFSELKEFKDIIAINQVAYGTGLSLVEDNGQWFGFAFYWYGDRLIRLDFGDSPLNTPSVVDLGDPLNILVFPQNIEIVKQNGIWYGLVTNIDNGAGIILLNFGSSLKNTPSSLNLGTFGTYDRIWDTKVIKQGLDYILVFAERGTNKIVRVNFRDSFSNSTVGYVYTSTIIGPSGINGLDVVWTGTSWKVLCTSNGSNQIYQIDFGTDLTSTAVVEAVYSSGVDKPYRVDILKHSGEFFVTASGEIAGDIRIFNYHDFNPAITPTVLPYTSISGIIGIDAIRYQGKNVLLGVGTTSYLKRAIFESDCGASESYSSLSKSPLISYLNSGTKKIELIAEQSASGGTDSKTIEINILNNIAPSIDFLSRNICANHDVIFTSVNSSMDVTNYSWSFGDSQTATDPNPTHQYTAAGEYNVSLQVTAENGCNNYAEKSIKIYDPPTPSFDLPTGLICTNNQFTFTNNTVDNFDGYLSYEWFVNDELKATSRDFNYAFATTGDQQVKLKASIPGCSNEQIQTLANVQSGPVVGFSYSGKCEEESVVFTNESAGAISGYEWQFGNGNSSTQENPAQVYTDYGQYDVKLQTYGTNGCVSTITQPVTIYSVPQTDFSLDLPPFACSESPSQFNDITPPMPDSNITGWAWSFGDPANGSASQKNPLYTYALAGEYAVSLTTTTNYGCSNSSQKVVTIYSSPKADFSFGPACVDKATVFTDLSTGDVKSWLWSIQGTTYSEKNPKHTFLSPSNYNALLTVTGGNNCVNQVSKNVDVPVPVVADFTTFSTCATQPAWFDEVNKGGADPAVSWAWNFAGQGTTSLVSPVQHIFSSTGNKPVTMTSTRQSGCTYSVTKSIPIISPPKAEFTIFLDAGPAPFPVDFTNTSSLASSYSWKFGDADNSTSTAFSPSFTYTELGEYTAALTASNAVGCTDTYSQQIRVVVPEINAALADLRLVKISGSNYWSPAVTIENKSNVALIDPQVYLDISGNSQISETVKGVIKPAESLSYTFTSTIAPRAVDFACAEIRMDGDTYAFDNRQCVNVTEENIAIAPYPNPTQDELMLEWISTGSEPVELVIYAASGQVVMSRQYDAAVKGLNQVKVDVSGLAAGIYLVSYTVDGQVKHFKFSVVR